MPRNLSNNTGNNPRNYLEKRRGDKLSGHEFRMKLKSSSVSELHKVKKRKDLIKSFGLAKFYFGKRNPLIFPAANVLIKFYKTTVQMKSQIRKE